MHLTIASSEQEAASTPASIPETVSRCLLSLTQALGNAEARQKQTDYRATATSGKFLTVVITQRKCAMTASEHKEQLNSLQRRLLAVRDRPTSTNREYYEALERAASAVYGRIKQALSEGNLVVAYKDNGRELEIGAIGPLSDTGFPYSLGWHLNYEEDGDAFKQCELLVIDRFYVRPLPTND